MPNMEKFLRGVARYNKNLQPLHREPTPKLLLLTCMDSRLQPHALTGADPGDSFVARNPGNFVPHSKTPYDPGTYSESAALEIAVVMAQVEHIVICGHSDCKALHHLLNTHGLENKSSFCTSWVRRQASSSLLKLDQLEKNIKPLSHTHLSRDGGHGIKLTFADDNEEHFEAVIDEKNNIAQVDKLSQISVLQQLVNLKSYDFIQERLANGTLNIHGLWVNLGLNEIFIFSEEHNKFILVNDESVSFLMKNIKTKSKS